jgi:hypothetical protein
VSCCFDTSGSCTLSLNNCFFPLAASGTVIQSIGEARTCAKSPILPRYNHLPTCSIALLRAICDVGSSCSVNVMHAVAVIGSPLLCFFLAVCLFPLQFVQSFFRF